MKSSTMASLHMKMTCCVMISGRSGIDFPSPCRNGPQHGSIQLKNLAYSRGQPFHWITRILQTTTPLEAVNAQAFLTEHQTSNRHITCSKNIPNTFAWARRAKAFSWPAGSLMFASRFESGNIPEFIFFCRSWMTDARSVSSCQSCHLI